MPPHFAPGEKLTVTIEKLSFGGDGIARFPSASSASGAEASSGFVIFVPYACPGELVEVVITEKKKNYARALITKIIKKNELRTEPPCPYFFRPDFLAEGPGPPNWCGGCNFQHLTYSAQLEQKNFVFQESVKKVAGIFADAILPMIGAEQRREWRYRNKMQIPFVRTETEGGVTAGFFAPGSHRIVPIEDCLIQPEPMMKLAGCVRATMEKWNLPCYSEKSHNGWLRHLLIRTEEKSGEILLALVTANDSFPKRAEWCKLISAEFPQIVGICQNVNPERTNVILGKQWKLIFGQDFLTEKLEGLGADGAPLTLKISAGSFFQVHTTMAEKLYRLARDWLKSGQSNKKLLLDLYCGAGGIGLACSPHFERVIGVDETRSSIENAQENARLNRAQNCTFICNDVLDFLSNFSGAKDSPTGIETAVVLDPPRAGCAPEVLRQIVKIAPAKIVYVSCEPSTLARDLSFLTGNRYAVKKIQPLDLFPQSSHIESVTLLEKVEFR